MATLKPVEESTTEPRATHPSSPTHSVWGAKQQKREHLYRVPLVLQAPVTDRHAIDSQLKTTPSSDKLMSESKQKLYRHASQRVVKEQKEAESSLANLSRTGRPRSHSSREVLPASHKSVSLLHGADVGSSSNLSRSTHQLAEGRKSPLKDQIKSPSDSLQSSLLKSTLDDREDIPSFTELAAIHQREEPLVPLPESEPVSRADKEKDTKTHIPAPLPQPTYTFEKFAVSPAATVPSPTAPTKKSTLSALIEKKAELSNTMAAQYAKFNAKMDPNPYRMKMMLPFSDVPSKSMTICVSGEATVDEVIGYTLYEYINEKLKPNIPSSLLNVAYWSIRIVEDDGEIDEDFPALERTRKIHKYAFDQFALINLKPLEDAVVKKHKSLDAAIEGSAGSSDGVSPSTPSVFLKVHLYSTLEVKQTTIMQMPLSITMQEVFDRICVKRKYDAKDYILKMADTKTDVPLDKTLQQLDAIEFCVLKRSSGGAGDIFLRPPEEETKKEEEFNFAVEDYRLMYKVRAEILTL
ncbi:hypothetical protein HDU91_000090 [Kappamyces sp. JEL0680]|nr:hypothetical protein HDU91_000090 [Kappamyces sp. JEL0680]